jgi:DNA polymerase kappa
MAEHSGNDGKNFSHLYVYSGANKAGMDGIDKEKQAQIIYEMSKDSAFFKRATKLDADTDLRVQAMKKTLVGCKGGVKQQLCETIAQQSLALESRRSFERICCVLDMDMFFAAVEIRDEPQLKDMPVAVGGMTMISTANYVARKYGVRAAMPGFIARKLCPQLVFVPVNFGKYQHVSGQIKDIIGEYDPQFTSHSLDEVYFDLTDAAKAVWCGRNGFQPPLVLAGVSHDSENTTHCATAAAISEDSGEAGQGEKPPTPTTYVISSYPLDLHRAFAEVPTEERPTIARLRSIASELLQEIRSRITVVTKGLTCSAGIANNFYLAKICADVNKPDGQYELPSTREDVLRFVSELPTRKIGGIGKVTERMLERLLEIRTMQQVRDHLPELMHTCTPVLFQFLLRTSLGIGSEEGAEGSAEERAEGGAHKHLRKSLGCERTYSAKGISDAAELYERLHKICASVGEDMVRKDLYAKAVTLKLKNIDFELTTRIATSATYFQSAEAIEALARPMLDEALPMRVRLMGVSVSKFQHAESAEHDPKQRDILSFWKGQSSSSGVPSGKGAAMSERVVRDDVFDMCGSDEDAASAGEERDEAAWENETCCASAPKSAASKSSTAQRPASETVARAAHTTTIERAPESFECPVCAQAIAGSLMAFNRHLDACLGVQDGSAASSSRAQSSTAQESSAGKGRENKDKRPACAENRREAAEKRARQDRLVLGITDYFAVQR